MQQNLIYLDNNATTKIDPEVLESMLPWLQENYGNPSSGYSAGRLAHRAVEKARLQVAELLGVRESEIIFTGCGTESINTAILSACSLDPDKQHVVTSTVEHSATIKLCDHLSQRGYGVTRVKVDFAGHLDLEELKSSINEETALVSLLWANNETGVIFPVEEIASICQDARVPLHLDAVQAVGKVPVRLDQLPVSFLSLSGHKLHCPKGVGALYINRRTRFNPVLRGSQEKGRRGGTENVASIVAMGAAAETADRHLEQEEKEVRAWRDAFEEAILARIPGTEVNGDREQRLPNTSNLSFEGIESEGALILLDEAGICCSAGSACTTGSVTPSHVLRAMGMSNDRARASLRFSFGRFNSDEDLKKAVEIVPAVIEKLRRLAPVGGSPVTTTV